MTQSILCQPMFELEHPRSESSPVTILMADDDSDDRLLTREAANDINLRAELRFVEDGEELMEYLKRRGDYADPVSSPRPDIILLDLNMPRKTGREALNEIKADPELRRIPVVVLTTSNNEDDIVFSYDLGVSSFIVKPAVFDGLVEVMRTLNHYWGDIVCLPPKEE